MLYSLSKKWGTAKVGKHRIFQNHCNCILFCGKARTIRKEMDEEIKAFSQHKNTSEQENSLSSACHRNSVNRGHEISKLKPWLFFKALIDHQASYLKYSRFHNLLNSLNSGEFLSLSVCLPFLLWHQIKFEHQNQKYLYECRLLRNGSLLEVRLLSDSFDTNKAQPPY